MALGPQSEKERYSGVVPRPSEILLLSSPGPLAQESLDFLITITSQRHEEAAYNMSKKLPKPEPEQKQHRLPQMLLPSSILIVWISTQKVPAMYTKLYERQRSFGGKARSEKRCSDCGGARGSQEATKNVKYTGLANHHAQDVVVLQTIVKMRHARRSGMSAH